MTDNSEKQNKYRTVKVPPKLSEQIEKEREINEFISYRSFSEFVIDGARRRLEKVREIRWTHLKHKLKYGEP